MADVTLAVATVVLIFSLIVFGMSYVSDREVERKREKESHKRLGMDQPPPFTHLCVCVCVFSSGVSEELPEGQT